MMCHAVMASLHDLLTARIGDILLWLHAMDDVNINWYSHTYNGFVYTFLYCIHFEMMKGSF